MITREQLKVGETYFCVINESVKRTVKFIGNEFVMYDWLMKESDATKEGLQTIISFLHDNNLMPKPKKRYWLWDVEFMGTIVKHSSYMDEKGTASDGYKLEVKLLKKHENEYIEVEND